MHYESRHPSVAIHPKMNGNEKVILLHSDTSFLLLRMGRCLQIEVYAFRQWLYFLTTRYAVPYFVLLLFNPSIF